MLGEPHHFGITIRHERDVSFYSRTLRLPLMAASINRGGKSDEMYRLRGAVNHVTWFQIGEGGTETFYLPSHPPEGGVRASVDEPGYCYIAYNVRGFDGFVERLARHGALGGVHEGNNGRCALARGPDAVEVLLFDNGDPSLPCRVTGIREIGLTAAGPIDAYREFFSAIGLPRREAPAADFIPALFNRTGAFEDEFFGHVRVLRFRDAAPPSRPPMFPWRSGEHIDAYNAAGIKHIAYNTDDIMSFYTRAASQGVFFLFPPVRIPGGSMMCYFSDPEGHVFEAMQVPRALARAAEIAGNLRAAAMDAAQEFKNKFANR